MDSRLEYSLRCDSLGAGVTAQISQTPSAVGWTEQTRTGLILPTGNAGTDTFTATAHGLAAGDAVYFETLTGGTGLVVGQTYYVVDSTLTANTFQISATQGGAAFNFTTNVTQPTTLISPTVLYTHTLYLSPNRYSETWVIERVTVQNTSVLKVPTASIYRGVLNPSALVDATQNGAYDVDDLTSPIVLNRGEIVIIQFTGCEAPTFAGTMSSIVYLGGQVQYGS